MEQTVYLNGAFMPIDQAQVSVLDRGFLFGDGVYEVIPVYAGKAFRLEQHLERLQQSLQAVSLDAPAELDWAALIEQLIEHNGGGDLSIYVQITRGSAPKRDHAFPDRVTPTVFMMASAFTAVTDLDAVTGIKAITLADNRWTRCFIKSICLQPNILLKHQATQAGTQDAILIRDGRVTEAAAANVFVVKDKVIYTAPKTELILGGITRDLIVEMAMKSGLDCREQAPSTEQLQAADEIWITSSTREIVPVVELDGRHVGDGNVGPLWYTAMTRYQAYKQTLITS